MAKRKLPVSWLKNLPPLVTSAKLRSMAMAAAGRPTESRKGTTVYHNHGSKRYVVRSLKVSLRGSNGVHYETHGYECVICGLWGNDKFKQMQLEALEELLG